jgi:hypothetical protein
MEQTIAGFVWPWCAPPVTKVGRFPDLGGGLIIPNPIYPSSTGRFAASMTLPAKPIGAVGARSTAKAAEENDPNGWGLSSRVYSAVLRRVSSDGYGLAVGPMRQGSALAGGAVLSAGMRASSICIRELSH